MIDVGGKPVAVINLSLTNKSNCVEDQFTIPYTSSMSLSITGATPSCSIPNPLPFIVVARSVDVPKLSILAKLSLHAT